MPYANAMRETFIIQNFQKFEDTPGSLTNHTLREVGKHLVSGNRIPFHEDWGKNKEKSCENIGKRIASIITTFPDIQWIVTHPFINHVEYFLGLEPTQEFKLNGSKLVTTAPSKVNPYHKNRRKPDLRHYVETGYVPNLSGAEQWESLFTIEECIELESYGIYIPEGEVMYDYKNKNRTYSGNLGILSPYGLPVYTEDYHIAHSKIFYCRVEDALRLHNIQRCSVTQAARNLERIIGGNTALYETILTPTRSNINFNINNTLLASYWTYENVVFYTGEVQGYNDSICD